jgi:hypothetical protein
MEPHERPLRIKVTLVKGDPDLLEGGPSRNWEIVFKVSGRGWKFHFTVGEPYLASLGAWRRLARGEDGIDFYQGNGEGSISLDDDDDMTFVAAPSGAGGDVAGSFTVQRAAVAGPLTTVLDEAEASGTSRPRPAALSFAGAPHLKPR